MNKKADGGMTILIILIALGSIWYGISYAGRECSTSDSCGKNSYCGSDFKCHEHPVIYQEIYRQDYTKPAWILGISAVLVALILRKRTVKFQEPQKQDIKEFY